MFEGMKLDENQKQHFAGFCRDFDMIERNVAAFIASVLLVGSPANSFCLP